MFLIIVDSVELPCPEKIENIKNVLDKNIQFKLWKERYDYSRADAILNKYNIQIKRKEMHYKSSYEENIISISNDQIDMSDNSCKMKQLYVF